MTSKSKELLGGVFGEEVVKIKSHWRIFGPDFAKPKFDRTIFFLLFFVLGMALLLGRLAFLTLFQGEKYRKLAEENRLRERKIPAPRGIIYDRKKEALVRNIPVFALGEKLFFEEKPATFSGEWREKVEREYIYGELFAHVLGFTGEITAEELGDLAVFGQRKMGDIVGKSGLEKTYEEILRGKDGQELFEVDALEEVVRVLGRKEPQPGQSLQTTLDLNLQKAVREALGKKKGAVVASNPSTGEILAYFSSPSFDPNKIIRREKELELYFSDEEKPLFDRVIGGLYPPGSTFKLIVAVAGLESGAIDKETKFEDTGVLRVGEFSFGNWYFSRYGKKEGMVDIVKGLQRSNDIFFYKVGEKTGIEEIARWAKIFGLGEKLGIDLPGEAKGLMPDPKWQKEVKGENWYLGNTYHVAIGQGDILATPLQVNFWTNVFASGGKACRPHLFLSLGKEEKVAGESICRDLGIKKETLELIREGMRKACSPGGTAWPLFQFKVEKPKRKIDGRDFLETWEATSSGRPLVEVPLACKTGTAEFGDPKGRTHAWLTVFAPFFQPEISLTVLVEGGGEGSSVAGPIAKKILESWFSR